MSSCAVLADPIADLLTVIAEKSTSPARTGALTDQVAADLSALGVRAFRRPAVRNYRGRRTQQWALGLGDPGDPSAVVHVRSFLAYNTLTNVLDRDIPGLAATMMHRPDIRRSAMILVSERHVGAEHPSTQSTFLRVLAAVRGTARQWEASGLFDRPLVLSFDPDDPARGAREYDVAYRDWLGRLAA